jgi:hypothetical protein
VRSARRQTSSPTALRHLAAASDPGRSSSCSPRPPSLRTWSFATTRPGSGRSFGLTRITKFDYLMGRFSGPSPRCTVVPSDSVRDPARLADAWLDPETLGPTLGELRLFLFPAGLPTVFRDVGHLLRACDHHALDDVDLSGSGRLLHPLFRRHRAHR